MLKISCILLLINFMLSGCMAGIFATATASAFIMAQHKTPEESIDDIKIYSQIKADFIGKKDHHLLNNITIKVNQGRVLLVGDVNSNEDVLRAVEICYGINGVKTVHNELKIDSNSTKADFTQVATDSWITSKIKTQMFLDRSIRNINYTVVTKDSVVYLFGIAKNTEELDDVTSIAGKVYGVQKVVSYVKILRS
jgi:osmotically-inducible protein OsmY